MADSRKPFKISELPLISNIDNDDLLIVSDKEGGKYYTKSMMVQQLIQKAVNAIAANPSIMAQISASAADAAEQAARQYVDSVIIPEAVISVILHNNQTVLDALDGKIDDQFTIGEHSGSANSQTQQTNT